MGFNSVFKGLKL